MKMTDCIKVRTIVLAAVLNGCLSSMSPVFGQSTFSYSSYLVDTSGKVATQLGNLGGR